MFRVAGDLQEDFPLQAMVSISNPFDVWSTINLMRGNIYETFFVSYLRKVLILRKPLSQNEKEIF